MRCIDCKYKFTCEKEQIETCKRYEKEPYSIVVKEGGIKKIERIEKK